MVYMIIQSNNQMYIAICSALKSLPEAEGSAKQEESKLDREKYAPHIQDKRNGCVHQPIQRLGDPLLKKGVQKY